MRTIQSVVYSLLLTCSLVTTQTAFAASESQLPVANQTENKCGVEEWKKLGNIEKYQYLLKHTDCADIDILNELIRLQDQGITVDSMNEGDAEKVIKLVNTAIRQDGGLQAAEKILQKVPDAEKEKLLFKIIQEQISKAKLSDQLQHILQKNKEKEQSTNSDITNAPLSAQAIEKNSEELETKLATLIEEVKSKVEENKVELSKIQSKRRMNLNALNKINNKLHSADSRSVPEIPVGDLTIDSEATVIERIAKKVEEALTRNQIDQENAKTLNLENTSLKENNNKLEQDLKDLRTENEAIKNKMNEFINQLQGLIKPNKEATVQANNQEIKGKP